MQNTLNKNLDISVFCVKTILLVHSYKLWKISLRLSIISKFGNVKNYNPSWKVLYFLINSRTNLIYIYNIFSFIKNLYFKNVCFYKI